MNYIAYTVGPIYDTIFNTLKGDNKTKRLKAGSYFFSLFMKTLLQNIKNDFDILVPYVEGEALTKEYKSMGLFHDRFIAQSDKSKEEMQTLFATKLETTFGTIAKMIEGANAAELFHNMDNHLIIASENELKNIDANIIFALNKILDSKELQRGFTFDMPKNNWIQKYQEQEVQKSSVKTIEEFSKNMNFAYYAVITADGDKMGAKIKKEATQSPQNIKNISEGLYNFFTQEDDIYTITHKHFGGELIYAGGDDILAFIPVKFDGKTFLDYICILDEKFKKYVGNDVSLSFGVNIAYYKYPLRDAINSAFDLLHEAKSDASVQNRLSLKITKHSGQWFNSTFALQGKKYELYKNLVDGILMQKVTLPHSLHHSLKRYEKAILTTYGYENSSVKAMFDTIFNDAKSDSDKQGLFYIINYLDTMRPENESDFDAIFSELSIIKFLRGDRE
ncbi:MAG: type III-B CRISPR-associated protein Cas10/Cmr2 [Arcobacteraceae bacterium]